MSGKAVAITGASSGIGEATALALARAGASVALGARRADRIEALARRIYEETGSTAVAREVDVGDEEQARAFVAGAAERLGRLDTLVNNAGVMLLGPIEGGDRRVARDGRRQPVGAPLLHGRGAADHARAGRGDIVNICSVAGRFARAGSAVYNLTKFGVNAFSEGLRQEVTDGGIRVMVVGPGFVATELQSHNRARCSRRSRACATRSASVLQPEEIADAILYAVSRAPHISINEILIRPTGQAR